MKKFGDKFTDIIYWFTSSWWAVIIHTIWFALWLIFRLNIHVLTLIVSLEAIYLCIFILMAQNRAEKQRETREARQRKIEEEGLKYDIKLDEKADRQLTELSGYSTVKARLVPKLNRSESDKGFADSRALSQTPL